MNNMKRAVAATVAVETTGDVVPREASRASEAGSSCSSGYEKAKLQSADNLATSRGANRGGSF